jgi:hypothetical protein
VPASALAGVGLAGAEEPWGVGALPGTDGAGVPAGAGCVPVSDVAGDVAGVVFGGASLGSVSLGVVLTEPVGCALGVDVAGGGETSLLEPP